MGTLQPGSMPDSKGVIDYIPFRSGSHYFMQLAIASGESPTCTYMLDNVEFSFIVESCPENGQLEIRDHRAN